jgi:hypothetical protein
MPNGRESDDPGDISGTGADGHLSSYLRDEIAGSQSEYFQAEDPASVSDVRNAIIETIAVSEEVFHRGTLAEDLAALTSSPVPLDSDLSTEFDEFADAETSPDRECFQAGVSYYIGFGWWLPEDVGNEVQGDSVSFDLGFYTEQCRNSDGA